MWETIYWIVMIGLGVVIGSFVMWRRIRDDFAEQEGLRLVGWTVLGSLLGAKLVGAGMGLLVWQTWNGMGGRFWDVGGALLGGYLSLWVMRDTGRAWGDLLDGLFEGWLWVYLIGLVAEVLWWSGGDEWWNVGHVILVIFGLVGLFWVRNTYRRYGWYRSGKVGLLFWLGLATWAWLRAIWEAVHMGSSAWWWWWAALFWAVTVGAGVRVYRLSGRRWGEDFEHIKGKLARGS